MEAKKYQLIPIEKGYIVISDEEIKKGDYYQFGGKSILQHDGHPNTGNYPKVITGHGDHRYVVISNECDKDCSSGDSICQTDLCKNKEIKITNSNAEIYQMWQEAKWREEAINKYGNDLHLWAKQRDGYVAAKKDSFSLEDMIEFGEYFANTYLGGGNFDKWQSQRLIPAPCDCEIKINGENVTVTKILL